MHLTLPQTGGHMSTLPGAPRAINAPALVLMLFVAGAACAAPAKEDVFHHRGEARAWALLEKAAAWGDSLRRPNARYWLEYHTALPCAPPGEGLRGLQVRIAMAGDGRMSWEFCMNPGPAGARMRYDGHRYVEHSLSGDTWLVVEGPMSAVKTSLAGEAGGFMANMALGLEVSGEVHYDTTRAARCIGPDSLFVDGRIRRCERVRIDSDSRWTRAHADDFWIDRESGCVWLRASVDSAGQVSSREPQARYLFVRTAVAPPESLFDTTVPAGARIVTDLESTRPNPLGDPTLVPKIAADSTVTFRWKGEAHGVALVGSFNCWDPRADPMVRGADGTWNRTHAVDVHILNDYLFLVDGTRWVMDPLNPGCRGDGFGGWVSCISPPPPGPMR